MSIIEPQQGSILYQSKTNFLRKRWMYGVGFVLLSLLCYFQCLRFGYVLDDKIVITDNAYTQKGFGGLWEILTTESFEGYFKEQRDLVQGGRYRPLSIMTFAIEDAIVDDSPMLSHLINIILYGLCGFLIFRLLSFVYKPTKSIWLGVPFLVALLYILHPIHTEAVANIKGRDEIMAMLFGLSALYYAIRYQLGQRGLHLVLMSVMFYLGLLSKENVLTFLGVIPLFLYAFGDRSWAKLLRVFGILLALTVVYLIQRYLIIGYLINMTPITDVMNNPFAEMSVAQKYGTIFYTLGKYFVLTLFPHPLTHDYYPYQIPIMDWAKPMVWLSLVGYSAATVWALINIKRRPHISYAWLFYVLTLFIVSNLVLGVGTFMNERFVFISSLGIVWILVHSIVKYLSQAKWLPIVVLGAIGIGYIAKTVTRVPVWENAMTLNRAAVKVSTNSARANSFMATALFNEYKVTTDSDKKLELLQEADIYVNKSLAIMPSYGSANLMAVGIAAELHKRDKDVDKLLNSFKFSLSRTPSTKFVAEYMDYLESRDTGNTKFVRFYAEVGKILRKQRKYDWAIFWLGRGLKLNPNDPQLRKVTANTYRMKGDEALARKYD